MIYKKAQDCVTDREILKLVEDVKNETLRNNFCLSTIYLISSGDFIKVISPVEFDSVGDYVSINNDHLNFRITGTIKKRVHFLRNGVTIKLMLVDGRKEDID